MTKTGSAAVLASVASIQSTFAQKIKTSNPSLKENYLLDPTIKYFNHGSIGTMPNALHESHKAYLQLCESNPWFYMWSDPWKMQRKEIREKASDYLGCNSDELIFNHNTTEGMNLLASGLPIEKGDEVVFSSLNHSGASVCWEHHGKVKGYTVKKFDFPIQEVTSLSKEDVIQLHIDQVSKKTKVLVIPHIDNVVGLRHPVKEIAQKARSKGVKYIAIDGAQSVGMIPVNFNELGVDFYCCSPHKWLQTPKGTGLMYLKKESQKGLHPMWVTWGQKSWKDSVQIFEDYGTRNLAEVMVIGDAIDFQKRMDEKKPVEVRKKLWEKFRELVDSHSKLEWKSSKDWDLGSSLYAIEIQGKDSREFAKDLFEKHGFVFRPFHSDDWNTVRMSLNINNSEEEIEQFISLVG